MHAVRVILSAFLVAAVGCVSAPPENAPIKVLLVDGFSNHDWQHTTRCLVAILDRTPGFEVAVSTYPEGGSDEEIAAWDPQFEAYDVVLQTCNNIKNKVRWPERVEKALEKYVVNGGGLFVFHSANNAFRNWPEYNRMIGPTRRPVCAFRLSCKNRQSAGISC
jgi:hypothetical protein